MTKRIEELEPGELVRFEMGLGGMLVGKVIYTNKEVRGHTASVEIIMCTKWYGGAGAHVLIHEGWEIEFEIL